MDIKRLILYAALAFVVFTLWGHWQNDYVKDKQAEYPTETLSPAVPNDTSTKQGDHLLPQMGESPEQEASFPANEPEAQTTSSQTVNVKTDVLDLAIDLEQGDIIDAALLEYPLSTENKDKPFLLLQNKPNNKYVANSSLFVVEGQQVQNINLAFKADNSHYVLASGEDKLTVRLKGAYKGLQVFKDFTFTKGSYLIEVSYHVQNNGAEPWKGYVNTQLLRTSPSEDKSSIFHIGSYTGASYSAPGQKKFQKVPFATMQKSNLDVSTKAGWVAMQEHYFLSAWIPEESSQHRFYTRALGEDFTIGIVSSPITVKPNTSHSFSTQLYVGPEIGDTLKAIAPGLDLTIDYGWLWFLSSFLFWVMKGIHSFVGNWGWTIVLVTVLIKLCFYRLSATSYKSMAAMRKLQPKLQALKERYGEDKAKISQATMELYRKEKVNPLGGCLPILIQIPVFIALYWVLLESVQLRQAPFIFWIQDLAAADPYHILPIIMGGTMLIQQK